MTVAATAAETVYPLNAANLGPFNSGWLAEDLSQIAVWLDKGAGAVQIGGGLVVITGASPLTAGINVTLSAGNLVAGVWPAGSSLTLQRVTPKTQPSALGEAVGFDPAVYEGSLDHLERQVQDLATGATHAIRGQAGDYPTPLPPPAKRAGLYLLFDGLGNPQAAGAPGAPAPGFAVVRVLVASDVANDTDQVIAMKAAGVPATFTLPDPAAGAGRIITVKDALGQAGIFAITVATAAGLIDGLATFVLDGPWSAATFISDGTQWSIV